MRSSPARTLLVAAVGWTALVSISCAPARPAREGAAAVPRTRMELCAALAKIGYATDRMEQTAALVDRLLARGPEGLERVLDVYFPESSPVSDRAAIEALVRDLNSDDYGTCRRAAQRLYELGPAIGPRIQEHRLDWGPAVRLWIHSVQEAWDYTPIRGLDDDQPRLADRLDQVKTPELLAVLARRAVAVLEKPPLDPIQERTVFLLLAPLAKSGDDRYSDLLMPYLRHPDVKVAVLVTKAMGCGRDNRYWPPLMSGALQSDRPEVVSQAVTWSPNCWDDRRRDEVRRLLRRVFEGTNEGLKFEACFPLMHGYQDTDARAYLIAQTRSPNRERAQTAMGWLGDIRNAHRLPEPGLVESIAPYLKSADDELRRRAAETLSIYGGEPAMRAVIPLLVDKEKIIVDATTRNLLDQRDKTTLRRVLKESLAAAPPGPLREKIAGLLTQLPPE